MVVPGDLPERVVGVGKREKPLVVRLGRLDEAPVVAEGLDVGFPDLANLVLRNRADLEAIGETVIGEVLDGRPYHLGRVRDRLVPCYPGE
jgi:hypothetical protein